MLEDEGTLMLKNDENHLPNNMPLHPRSMNPINTIVRT
jgi:hypothetical protein